MKSNKKSLPSDVQTRLCAIEILGEILYKNQPFDTVFDKILRGFMSFESRDIGFIRETVMQVLRRLGQIDDILKQLCDRPLEAMTPLEIVTILRLGAAQMLFMDVKPHAAVDTSVRAAEALGLLKQKGFINGVLRNLDRRKETLLTAQAGSEGRLNTPDWLYTVWEKDYGAEIAAEIAKAHLNPAPVDLTVKNAPDKWAESFGGVVLPGGSVRLEKTGRVPDMEGYGEGEWWVQSAAAALPVQLMNLTPDMYVVDLCAAPGGKTMQLAAAGAKVAAVDISRNRMARLKENLDRCRLSADLETGDGKIWKPRRPADIVLIDAPCTATGTIRHQPDVLHLKSRTDMDKLIETQTSILKNAAGFVKRGGQIIYCTCSLQKAESEDVISDFINKNNTFKLNPYTKDDIPWLADAITEEGYIRLLPQHLAEKGGMDGFFIARVIRS